MKLKVGGEEGRRWTSAAPLSRPVKPVSTLDDRLDLSQSQSQCVVCVCVCVSVSDSQSRQSLVLLEQQLWNLAQTVLVETPGWTEGQG